MKINMRISFSVLLFMVLYSAFVIVDLRSSVQMGFVGADRQKAHILILAITLFMIAFLLMKCRYISVQRPLNSLIALALWITLVNILNHVSTWGFLVQANMCFLWIFSYLFFNKLCYNAEDGYNQINILTKYLYIFYIGIVIYYFFDMMARYNRFPVINAVYYLLALLPWQYVYASLKKKRLLFLTAVGISLLSMKRGAIVAIAAMILVDQLFDGHERKNMKPFFKTILMIALFLIFFKVADYYTGGFLSNRFSLTELQSGSGRSVQFSIVINKIKNRDLGSLLFGVGSEKSVNTLGTGIHNEWLNFIFCYGLIGLILYIIMILRMILQAVTMYSIGSDLFRPTCMMLVLYLMLSAFSTGYGGYSGLWLFGFWGFANAELDKSLE